jgi:hypothetical protein
LFDCALTKRVPTATLVPWESFRPKLKAAFDQRRALQARRGTQGFAGRKPWDEVVIFKVLVLQALYVPDAKLFGSIVKRWRKRAWWNVSVG